MTDPRAVAEAFVQDWIRNSPSYTVGEFEDAITALLLASGAPQREEIERLRKALTKLFTDENDYWIARATEEDAAGNGYQAHAYRAAAHAIRMARDKADAL